MFWRLKGSKVKRRTSCALLALVLLPVALSGQRYSFKHYDRDTGLPNLSVTTLLQDRTGFLWVGTENGLFRYDGRRFRSFTTADGLPSSRVEGLEQTRDGTQTVRSSSGSLLSIVNDILDLSRIEAGKLCLDATVFDLPELAGAAIGNVAPQAQQKRLELMSHIGDGVPRSLVGDPLRLRQVLINLLNNAVKFTERGGVSLQVNGEEGTESPLLHFEVVDTGLAFSQADGSLTRRYGGTGLGLTFAEMMQGRMWVESELGKGSRFHFTARFRCAPEAKAEAVNVATSPSFAPAAPTLSLLLAEDNPVNQNLALRLLVKRGHMVVAAANGKEAVAAFEQRPFDAVLMDIQMPEMSGFEATAAIRARELGTGTRIRIIAMTAHAMSGDRERCLAAGMDDYIAKPIRSAELFAAVERR